MIKKFKKLMVLGLSVVACGVFMSCSKEPVDLNGKWKQINSNSEDSWQSATIEDGKITIDWVTNNGDTTMIYWEGSYIAPTEYSESYTWESENQREDDKWDLLASDDDFKTITYEDGQISYEVSAMGSTSVVRLEREE